MEDNVLIMNVNQNINWLLTGMAFLFRSGRSGKTINRVITRTA